MSRAVKQGIMYGSCKFKVLSEFYNIKQVTYDYAEQFNKSGNPSTLALQAEKLLLDGMQVIDNRKQVGEISLIREISSKIRLKEEKDSIKVRFDFYKAYADILQKGNRGHITALYDVILSTIKFEIRNRFILYNEESYSIAVKIKEGMWFSIGVGLSDSGLKGTAEAVIKVIDGNNIFIDNLSKYIDTRILTDGMNP